MWPSTQSESHLRVTGARDAAPFRHVLTDRDLDFNGSLPWLAALEDPQLASVIDAMLQQPEQPHTVESLATIAHMSRSSFARRFAECFDRPPMDYCRDVRLRRAAQLLNRDDLSVDEIATKVGFSSRSHFSRTFRDHFGASPLAFREDLAAQ